MRRAATSPGPPSRRRPTRSTTSASRWSPTSASRCPAELRVDGGMIRNDLLMQFQADILDRPVVAPPIAEISALGAAYAAGLAVGFWSGLDELRAMDRADRRWTPAHGRGDPRGGHRPLAQGRRADARLGRSDRLTPDDRVPPNVRPGGERRGPKPRFASRPVEASVIPTPMGVDDGRFVQWSRRRPVHWYRRRQPPERFHLRRRGLSPGPAPGSVRRSAPVRRARPGCTAVRPGRR